MCAVYTVLQYAAIYCMPRYMCISVSKKGEESEGA